MVGSRILFAFTTLALITPLLAGCGGGGGTSAPIVPSVASPTPGAQAANVMRRAGAKIDPASTQSALRHVYPFAILPSQADLSASMPPVGDQGQENSCVGWAIGYGIKGYLARKNIWSAIAPKTVSPSYNFSAAYVYNQTNDGVDEGAYPSDVLNVMKTQGIATLADMPYVDGQFTAQPSAQAVTNAAQYKIASWGTLAAVRKTNGWDWATPIRTALAQGSPVAVSIPLNDTFRGLNASNAVWSANTTAQYGTHEVVVVGYSDATQRFKMQNSWGANWGENGFFYATYGLMNQAVNEAVVAFDPPAAAPAPSATPVSTPTATPTPVAVVVPAATPTPVVTPRPTVAPTIAPTVAPAATPTPIATPRPLPPSPTPTPIATPRPLPPSPAPTLSPTPQPTATPKVVHGRPRLPLPSRKRLFVFDEASRG